MNIDTEKLVNGQQLLEIMFPPNARPSLRWLLDMRRRRRVPFYKLGHLVFYDPVKVREHWTRTGVVRAA